jgi:hypothetical protein
MRRAYKGALSSSKTPHEKVRPRKRGRRSASGRGSKMRGKERALWAGRRRKLVVFGSWIQRKQGAFGSVELAMGHSWFGGRFELFGPLHQLWLGYMSELLGLPPTPKQPPLIPVMPSAAGMHAKLVKADFHGSIMTGPPSLSTP